MRSHGRASELPEVGATDHVCWVYAGEEDLDVAVGRFLDGALARGERVLGIGEAVIESLDRVSVRYGGSEALAARGALETLTLDEVYAATGEFRRERQFGFHDAATHRAVTDGFTGLRVIAEGSLLAADPDLRAELIRWEHLADDYIAQGSRFTAMCAYRSDLGPDALSDVASVHPVARTPDGVPAFRVFFDEDRVVLTGSVDAFSAAHLEKVLAASPIDGTSTLLDLGLLDFLDIAGCRVLARWARSLEDRGGRLEVTGASRLVQRVWDILALHRLAHVRFVGVPA
jgi:anti-anti-sigma factor